MATARRQDLSYVLKIQDQFGRELKRFETQLKAQQSAVKRSGAAMQGFNRVMKAVFTGAVAFAALRFFKSSIELAAVQQDAINQLALAQKNLGVFTEESVKIQEEFASSLQAVTTLGDETILKTQALLTTFGLYGDELQRATESTADFAAAQGIDLKAAALLVGKAFVGETSSLSRYGIILDEGIPKTEKFDAVLLSLNTRFGGAAQEATRTYAGQVKQLSNQFGDLQEQIGRELVPVADFWIRNLKSAIAATQNLGSEEQKNFTGRQLTIKSLEDQLAVLSRLAVAEKSREGVVLFQTQIERTRVSAALEREKDLLAAEQSRLESQKSTSQETVNIKVQEVAELQRLDALVAENKLMLFQLEQQKQFENFEKKLATVREGAAAEQRGAAFEMQLTAQKNKFIALQEAQLENFKKKLTDQEVAREKAKTAKIIQLHVEQVQNTLQLAAQVFAKNKEIAIATIALEKGIAIARAISGAAKIGGPFGAILAAAQVGLIAARFGQEIEAIRGVGVEFQPPGVTTPGAGTFAAGEERIPVGVTGARGALGRGGAAPIIINVGGIMIDFNAENVELENVDAILRRLADVFEEEAPSAIALALKSARLAESNQELAS